MGRAERAQQLQVAAMGLPIERRNEVVGVESHRNRPHDDGRRLTRRSRCGQQCRHRDVTREPVEAGVRQPFWIEDVVVDDPVYAWGDAGQERHMRWKRVRRLDARDTRRPGPQSRERAERRCPRFRVDVARGHQPVDRDHPQARARLRRRSNRPNREHRADGHDQQPSST